MIDYLKDFHYYDLGVFIATATNMFFLPNRYKNSQKSKLDKIVFVTTGALCIDSIAGPWLTGGVPAHQALGFTINSVVDSAIHVTEIRAVLAGNLYMLIKYFKNY